jgi:2-oxoglutarate dehydrogenase E2 component (dihydrolipoamide succinyltransferase)
MTIEIKVPVLGESITEATVGRWFKRPGDMVRADEPLVELETDKVTVEVPAPSSGILAGIVSEQGSTVAIGSVLGSLRGDGDAAAPAPAATAPTPPVPTVPQPSPPRAAAAPATPPISGAMPPPAPSARKILAEAGIDAADVPGSGRRGQVLKPDAVASATRPAQSAIQSNEASAPSTALARETATPMPVAISELRVPSAPVEPAREERVRMTRLRQTIARRLKDAQNTAAILTTFNDVDMSAVMALRSQYKELFERRHGVKLGFMSFFVKACIQALREIPAVNAEIDGEDLVYKNYYHIGVAVGTDRGLVVPVLRDADRMSLAEIELAIAEFGQRARAGKLGIEDMQGGTFTISNGGVYGSMLSTPIINAPQSGILGMHRIEERPVVRNGAIVARPMMYLALSYDHRIVDGKEAVTFLVRVKECLEDPQRFILEL